MACDGLPSFVPHRLLRNGHLQTLAAFLPRRERQEENACRHRVGLEDGDQIVLHDDRPPSWPPGGRTALLVHGLAGSHRSAYMVRIAGKLNRAGVRTFRMDLRICGAGLGLARRGYHSGLSSDVAAAAEAVAKLCPDSPTTVIGFSLSGNTTLKLLGECGNQPPGHLDSGLAVCPPVDLLACALCLGRRSNRWYDRHFTRELIRQVELNRQRVPDAPGVQRSRLPRTILEFDQNYTARVWGFGSAENYYHRCSAGSFTGGIQLPTLILTARDDPLIPIETYAALSLSKTTHLHITDHGGHMGFVGSGNGDPDRRWMDWRVVDWVTRQGCVHV